MKKIRSLYENYKSFPKVDCGYCKNASCITLLRKACAGLASFSDCIYFRSGLFDEKEFECNKEPTRTAAGPSVTYVNPCPSASELVTVEVNFASPKYSMYGYLDMVTAEKIFGGETVGLRVSPSLGLARQEVGGSAIMAFSEGRILVRRALDEYDAFWQLSCFVRLFWAAVN